MAKYTIYHNPRCSKSRQTLELLKQKVDSSNIKIIEYLKAAPSQSDLAKILKSLNLKPQDIMRKSEAEYKESGLADGIANQSLSEKQQIALMIANPKIIERPIVIAGDKAILGRPPENVLTLLK